jgi:hypothetical protein
VQPEQDNPPAAHDAMTHLLYQLRANPDEL